MAAGAVGRRAGEGAGGRGSADRLSALRAQADSHLQALRSKTDTVEIAQKVIPNEIHDLSLTFEDLVDVYFEGSEFMLNHLLPSR